MSNYPGALSGGFVSHRFVSLKSDQPDLSVVNPTNWNQSHIIGSGAIQSGALGASAVNSGNLAANSVTSGVYVIGSGAIQSGALGANTVVSGNVVSGAVKWVQLLNTSKPYVLVTPNGPTDGGDYGPNTPGTTTAGIQEAINSLSSTGGVVALAFGQYTISSTIVMGNNNGGTNFGQCLIGQIGAGLSSYDGSLKPTIKTNGHFNAINVNKGGGIKLAGIRIENIYVEGITQDKANFSEVGVWLENTDITQIVNVSVTTFPIGFQQQNGDVVNISRCSFQGNGAGVFIASSSQGRIEMCDITNNGNSTTGGYGLQIQAAGFFKVHNCAIQQNGNATSASEGSGWGIVITDSVSTMVTQCSILLNASNGILLAPSGTVPTDSTVIVGNYIYGNGNNSHTNQEGIRLNAATNTIIEGNFIFDAPNYYSLSHAASTQTWGIIEDNTNGACLNNLIVGNRIWGNTAGGTNVVTQVRVLAGSGSKVTRNQLYNSANVLSPGNGLIPFPWGGGPIVSPFGASSLGTGGNTANPTNGTTYTVNIPVDVTIGAGTAQTITTKDAGGNVIDNAVSTLNHRLLRTNYTIIVNFTALGTVSIYDATVGSAYSSLPNVSGATVGINYVVVGSPIALVGGSGIMCSTYDGTSNTGGNIIDNAISGAPSRLLDVGQIINFASGTITPNVVIYP